MLPFSRKAWLALNHKYFSLTLHSPIQRASIWPR